MKIYKTWVLGIAVTFLCFVLLVGCSAEEQLSVSSSNQGSASSFMSEVTNKADDAKAQAEAEEKAKAEEEARIKAEQEARAKAEAEAEAVAKAEEEARLAAEAEAAAQAEAEVVQEYYEEPVSYYGGGGQSGDGCVDGGVVLR